MHRNIRQLWDTPVFGESGIKYVGSASTGYITVIIARIPKINDSQRCSEKIFVEDNGDRRRYSGAMTGMSRFLPPHVHTSGDGRERLREFRMRARNASQNRLQSDWRRIAPTLLFFSILAYAHLVEAWRPARAWFSRVWPSAKLFLRVSPWRRFIRCVPVVCVRVCVAARCYTLCQCYRFAYEFVQRPRIEYCCIQSNKREPHAVYTYLRRW